MYINADKHILSMAILKTAALKIAASLVSAVLRLLFKRFVAFTPDMFDTFQWNIDLILSILQILLTALIFYSARKKLDSFVGIIPEEDREALGSLQNEYLGDKKSTLSVSSVSRLLDLWAVIFIAAELILIFTGIMYRKFITGLMALTLSSGTVLAGGTFLSLYNMSHGFKYMEILTSILFGVVMTGIFLNDRFLKLSSFVILILFLLSFGVFEMRTISLMGRDVGIVWSSVIFHLTETLGLIGFSFYLSKKYKGM